MGSIVQMQTATSGGNEDALAQIDISRDGFIVGVDWAMHSDLDADDEYSDVQLSFGSSRVLANDSRQVISVCSVGVGAVTTSGARPGQANKFVPLPSLPVGAGERLFLHAFSATGVVTTIFCLVHFSFDEPQAAVRRR